MNSFVRHGKNGSNKENAVLDKCHKLGAAVIVFDMLKVKHYNAINLEKVMKGTIPTIKEAAFTLYNVTQLLCGCFGHIRSTSGQRILCTVVRIHSNRFCIIKTEEEWQIFFWLCMGFPSMLERCMNGIANGHISIHMLCTFCQIYLHDSVCIITVSKF